MPTVFTYPANKVFEGEPVHRLGFLTSREELALLYSAADVTVVASLEEVFPNTVAESLACGTPVVGFTIAGLSDMIQNGHNGYIVDVGKYKSVSGSDRKSARRSRYEQKLSRLRRKAFKHGDSGKSHEPVIRPVAEKSSKQENNTADKQRNSTGIS